MGSDGTVSIENIKASAENFSSRFICILKGNKKTVLP
jgi:hypothetical protein